MRMNRERAVRPGGLEDVRSVRFIIVPMVADQPSVGPTNTAESGAAWRVIDSNSKR